ncbi:hypothetical protein RDI58_022782 [Solanum bulbocastanum]|uniref:Uncharacterized protein n=1 Tax=Solanum bulbocastanum TaxID=147425 RepID=A0AAN8Y8L0_SOLBU
MYVYRADTTTKRSIQNRLNANTFDDFARRQEGEIGMQQLGLAVIAAISIYIGLRGVLLHVALPQCIVPFVFAKQYSAHLEILSTLLGAWNSLSNACAL